MNSRTQKAWDYALDILKPDASTLAKGLELHKNNLVIDSYGFSPSSAVDGDALQTLLEEGATRYELKISLEEMRSTLHTQNQRALDEWKQAWEFSGVNCIFQNAGEEGNRPDGLLRRFACFTRVTDHLNDFITKAITSENIVTAHKNNKRSMVLTCNGVPLHTNPMSAEESLSFIRTYANLGCRMMHLTYNRRNQLGEGCMETTNAGLSALGAQAILELNRTGIMIDVAHSNWQTSLDAANASERPIIASHTACADLHNHPRAKPDEVLKAIAKKGGVIGIVCIPGFLGAKGDISSFLDQIDYLKDCVGIDRIAIGSDRGYRSEFDDAELKKITAYPKSRSILESYWSNTEHQSPNYTGEQQYESLSWTNWPLFTVGLTQRGYSDKDIQKILNKNILRYANDVWV